MINPRERVIGIGAFSVIASLWAILRGDPAMLSAVVSSSVLLTAFGVVTSTGDGS